MTEAIVARDLDVDFSKVPRFWLGGNATATAISNGVNMLFPHGERFFVRSVKYFLDQIDDPVLRGQIKGFFGQEGRHAHAHDDFNADPPATRATRSIRFLDGYKQLSTWLEERTPPKLRLAVTAAAEHFTAIMAEGAFRQRRARRVPHPRCGTLLAWHAAEEIEHKAVAFDVLQKIDPSYALRIARPRATRPRRSAASGCGARSRSLRQDKVSAAQRDRQGCATASASATRSSGACSSRGIRQYLRRDFHPNDNDDNEPRGRRGSQRVAWRCPRPHEPLDQVVVITGAGSGIGRATALAFAQEGYRIVAMRYRSSAASTRSPPSSAIARCSCARSMSPTAPQMAAFADAVHALVAGGRRDRQQRGRRRRWRRSSRPRSTTGTGSSGSTSGRRPRLPLLHPEDGRARHRRSRHQHLEHPRHLSRRRSVTAYVASKFAVLGLSQSLRTEMEPHRIGVTAICPGMIDTGIIDDSRMAGQHTTRDKLAAAFHKSGAPPALVAKTIVDAVRTNPAVRTVGRDAAGDPPITRWRRGVDRARWNAVAPLRIPLSNRGLSATRDRTRGPRRPRFPRSRARRGPTAASAITRRELLAVHLDRAARDLDPRVALLRDRVGRALAAANSPDASVASWWIVIEPSRPSGDATRRSVP